MKPPMLLYHCLYQTLEGDSLRPTCEREVNGKEGTFLFAADRIAKALAFAFSYHNHEVLMNGGIAGTANEFVILYGGQDVIDRPRQTTLLSFPNINFERMGQTCQWVSEYPVPFNSTQTVFQTSCLNVLMHRGLQILVLPQTHQELPSDEFLGQYYADGRMKFSALKIKGELRWLNEERGVNACATLASNFYPKTNAPQAPKAVPC